MSRLIMRALLGMALSVTLAACVAPAQPAVPSPAVPSPAVTELQATAPATMAAPPAETVIAPSGEALTRCARAGTEVPGTVDGRRIDWSCGALETGEPAVLVGDIAPGDEGWVIERATISAEGGAQIEGAESVLVLGIELVDGMQCFSAGTGATAGYQDQRLNFTCGGRSGGTFTALFGELIAADDGYRILRATGAISEQGFQADSSDTATVAALYIGG